MYRCPILSVRPSVRVCIRTDEGAQHCGVPVPEPEAAAVPPTEPPPPPAAEPLARQEVPPG